jgi:hypothetical protein
MHALVPILTMAKQQHEDQQEQETSQSQSQAQAQSQSQSSEKKRLQALEAKAVAEATATADAAFTPSPSLLNASSALALLKQVDGPSLESYEGKESVYVGRSVPIAAGGSLAVPIQVTTPGSVVEYAVENKQYDIGFGVTAEREEGITVVKVRTSVYYLYYCILLLTYLLTYFYYYLLTYCMELME